MTPSDPVFRVLYNSVEESAMKKNGTLRCCKTEAQMPCFHGLHMRNASGLVQLARGFSSKVQLKRGRLEADAKSILNVLILGISFKAKVQIEACGDDAEEAVRAVSCYLNEQANCCD